MIERRIRPDPRSINITSWLRRISLEYLIEKSRGNEERANEIKKETLEMLKEAYSSQDLSDVFRVANSFLNAQKLALIECGYEVFDYIATTKSRLLVGMSSEFGRAIFEVGLSWNHNLNLPYIPGSSLKGAFRSYLELKRPDLANLLGSKEASSAVIFLDSYPINSRGSLIVPEVTTPIYREKEGKIKETEASPVPIVYLAVNKGVGFRMLVGVRLSSEKCKELADNLETFLRGTLMNGIGAKTLLGYGILSVP